MVEQFKEKELRGMIERNVNFSKGDSGRILIIGATEQYVGSSVLAGLAALRAGADSVLIAAPEKAARLMNSYSPDLITAKLSGDDYTDEHLEKLGELSAKASVVLLGPGLGTSPRREEWLRKLLASLKAPAVIDADATKQVAIKQLEKAIILANKREYELFKERNKEFVLGTNIIVVKGKDDIIYEGEKEWLVIGGHAGATVAGTGDVLAGVTAALFAQTKDPGKAAKAACVILKKAAEHAGETHSFGFVASDLISLVPKVMNDLRVFRVTKYELTPLKTEKRRRFFGKS